ncbi:TetR/AcrR family transcriptional regulator [Erwinia sp. V71]|uniref:TetR/AcrR family transcriptional regulator n=1 Tax=Erwinia sp. V71 TaxID=3369424 RepID=UPI003F61DC6F
MSEKATVRKRQPEYVRQQLLQSAARLAAEKGIAGVTVNAVAEAAGVTKGGFFHHFPSKHALVDAMFDEILQQVDIEVDQLMARDPEPWGRFTRAYVSTAFMDIHPEYGWAALSFSILNDIDLSVKWDAWLSARMEQHQATDSDPVLNVVRLAADGVCLRALLNRSSPKKQGDQLEEQLLAMTRRPERQG